MPQGPIGGPRPFSIAFLNIVVEFSVPVSQSQLADLEFALAVKLDEFESIEEINVEESRAEILIEPISEIPLFTINNIVNEVKDTITSATDTKIEETRIQLK